MFNFKPIGFQRLTIYNTYSEIEARCPQKMQGTKPPAFDAKGVWLPIFSKNNALLGIFRRKI